MNLRRRLRARRHLVVALIALALVTNACTDKEADMVHMHDTAAEQIVQTYADQVLQLSGWSGYSQSLLSPAPCEGRHGERSNEIYATQGAYQLLVPGPEQQPIINRIRDGWRSLGYSIITDRAFGPNHGGQVHATNPADGTSLILGTGEVPALSLLIHTACYHRTTPTTTNR